MRCPYCGHENTPGADECEGCLEPLSPVEPAATPAGHNILYTPIRGLRPAPPVCLAHDTPAGEAIRTMAARRIGCVLVTEDEELVGIFSERDVLMRISQNPAAATDRPVYEFMTPKPETVDMQDEVAFALHKMDVGGYRHLPVMDGERVAGIISVRDVLKLLVHELAPAD